MSFLRTATRNVLSNYAGFVVAAVVMFLLRPVVIEQLGESVAGIWLLIVSCTGYYGLLDLGIRSAVGQYVTRYWAKGDIDSVNRTLSTALVLTGIAAAALLVVTLVLAFTAHGLFGLQAVDPGTTTIVFLIVGGGVAINFPLAIFQSATYARQRFDVANAIGIADRLLAFGLFYWVLTAGYGLIGLAVVQTGLNLLTNVLRVVVAFRLLPGLALGRRYFVVGSVRELWSFGSFNFVVNAADQILLNSAAVVIGIVLAEAAILYYDNGAFLVVQYLLIVNQIAWVLTPHATALDTRRDLDGLRQLWLTGTRIILVVASLIGAGIVLLGEDFIRLWLGSEFVSGETFASSASIASVLAIGALLRCGLSCGKQICFGLREVRFLARIAIVEALLNLALSLILIFWLGLVGVALAALIATLSVQLVFQPQFVARRLEMPLWRFVAHVPWGGVAVIAVMAAVDSLVGDRIQIEGWRDFLWKAFVVSAPALIVGVWIGTTRAEKERLIGRFRKTAKAQRTQ